jgi:hypothetical protein
MDADDRNRPTLAHDRGPSRRRLGAAPARALPECTATRSSRTGPHLGGRDRRTALRRRPASQPRRARSCRQRHCPHGPARTGVRLTPDSFWRSSTYGPGRDRTCDLGMKKSVSAPRPGSAGSVLVLFSSKKVGSGRSAGSRCTYRASVKAGEWCPSHTWTCLALQLRKSQYHAAVAEAYVHPRR